MARSDTETHRIELLLTLDYLLNETDEDHPATASAICEHAKKYGLVYNGGVAGDDVKRQRIGKCLHYLKYIFDKYPDESPFIIEQTKSGKFYVEQKSIFNEEQVINILAAVKNDKYTSNEDTDFLIERLLDVLSSKYKRDFFKEELKRLNKGVKKYDDSTNRKIRLINKAYKEGRLIKIRSRNYNMLVDFETHDCWYRVYRIMEFNNKPYVILFPISTGKLELYKNYLFDAVENLNIPKLPIRQILLDDDKRDLDKEFKKRNKFIERYYSSIEEMFEKDIMPVSGIATKVSFYFPKSLNRFIKKSFEGFFSTTMDYVMCSSFKTVDEKEVGHFDDKFFIVPHPLEDNKEPTCCVVNTFVDYEAFISWLSTDVYNDGTVAISDMVTVVGPRFVNKRLYQLYAKKAKRIATSLTPEEIEKMNALNEIRPHIRTKVKLDK